VCAFLALIRLVITSVPFAFLHGPSGNQIVLNVEEISSIREITDGDNYHDEVHCVVTMTNGKVFGIAEGCIEVFKVIDDAQRKAKHIIDEPSDIKSKEINAQ
jgi:hypothetical protein